MAPAYINVVIPFDPKRSDGVNTVLRGLTRPDQGNRPLPAIERALDAVGVVHFMSITVVEPRCPAEDAPPVEKKRFFRRPAQSHLLIEISADGGTEEALTSLSEAANLGPQLKQILAAANIALGDEALGVYLLRQHRVISDSWGGMLGQVFAGSPGLTATRIRQEGKLAERISELVAQWNGCPVWKQSSARQRLERVRDKLWQDGDKWAFVAEPADCLKGSPESDISITNPQIWKVGFYILSRLLWPLAVLVLAVFVAALGYWVALLVPPWPVWVDLGAWGALTSSPWLPWALFLAWKLTWRVVEGLVILLLLFFAAAYWRLRYLEKTDPVDHQTPPSHRVEELMRVENFCAQNHLASVSRLKPSLLRRLTLRIAFIVVGTGQFVCAPGFLGKNGVIHFARWMLLPHTDQMLFCSNYDGTWSAYVGDFIADAPTGVTAIWSNCVGFPRTTNLYADGADNRDQLVPWARRQQHPTRFWYSGYRDLTAARIRINAAIRQGVAEAESDADCRDWLALFGSSPLPAGTLRTAEIPTLVFGGLSPLAFAECHLIEFGNDVAQCKKWLEQAADQAAYGEMIPDQRSAVVVALSATGLKKLGMSEDALATFPPPFQQGMWPDWRARELGDINGNAPIHWLWGNEECQVDVAVVIYGMTSYDLGVAGASLMNLVSPLGHKVVRTLRLAPLPGKLTGGQRSQREAFGFTDGISQPIINGTPKSRVASNRIHVIEAGEIVLGYPDNTGKIPPSPSIADHCDPDHFLPDAGTDPFRTRPDAAHYEGNGRRDLGTSGTFLVMRQLDQDVAAFEGWLDTVDSQVPPGTFVTKVKEAVAAKLVGRWRDGTSLVRHPLYPGAVKKSGTAPDNDFMLGAEDPGGLKCPFGAHIRRANPRDTRFPGEADEIATVNRHRILRVGRAYGPIRTRDPGQGLLFMCLNADIERQFEFIQKTWLLNPHIQGLRNEVDPVMGQGDRTMTVPTAMGPLRLKIGKDIPDFVRTRGGGYFFLPGLSVLRYLSQPLNPGPASTAAASAQAPSS